MDIIVYNMLDLRIGDLIKACYFDNQWYYGVAIEEGFTFIRVSIIHTEGAKGPIPETFTIKKSQIGMAHRRVYILERPGSTISQEDFTDEI